MKATIIELTPNPEIVEDVFTDRLSLEKLKELWGEKANYYTDAQLYKIREFAYTLCEVIFKIIKRQQPKIIDLSHEPINEGTESNTLRPCEYRRAS